MKINEIIKEKRLALNYTQEQLATLLNVSIPAVSKWESGISYPDITLLPILARVLNTDLNTLLSFKETLTSQEIAEIVNDLSVTQGDFKMIIQKAQSIILEYPTCYALIYQIALILEGQMVLKNVEVDIQTKEYIDSLYKRVLKSDDMQLISQVLIRLSYKALDKNDLEKAKQYINQIPQGYENKRSLLEINVDIKEENFNEAGKKLEQSILNKVSELDHLLMLLMEVNVKEGKTDNALKVVEVSSKLAKLFELWEYNQYYAKFQLSVFLKDEDLLFEVLPKMLKSLDHAWQVKNSLLYSHMIFKDVSDLQFLQQMKVSLLQSLNEYDFIGDKNRLNEVVSKV